jgi:hypothetical protein
MRHDVAIEDIEGMRRREGIEDVELRNEIGKLRVGDIVKLTLLAGPALLTAETVRVRIDRIRGSTFRGRLTAKPASPNMAQLEIGSALIFTKAHIHSLAKG